MVGVGGGFFQDGVGADHLAGHQVPADAEMFERTLGLRAPELVGRNVDLAEAVGFFANVWHLISRERATAKWSAPFIAGHRFVLRR